MENNIHFVVSPETSAFKTISIFVGIGSNYKEKSFKKLSSNMTSPCSCRVGSSSLAEAKKLLQKLDRDYQHAYWKYTELQSSGDMYYVRRWYKYCARGSDHYSRWIGYCISQSEDAVEQLQMVLDKLNTGEAPKRERDTSSNSKQFFSMHGCKSLAQERKKLHLKHENKEEYNDDMSQDTIDIPRMNDKLDYIQRIIPTITSKKPIYDLLRPINKTKKLIDKAISNGALVGNHTSQAYNLESSTSIEIKLLTKLIRVLAKEKEKVDDAKNTLQDKSNIEKGYKEKMMHLQEKLQCIDAKRDAERKYILDLKKQIDAETASQ